MLQFTGEFPISRLHQCCSLNLQEVPDAIGGLEHLEELRLASNDLVSLPDSIGLLSNLKILDVSGNRLRVLPDTISKCR